MKLLQMELSEIFSFLAMLKESVKLLPKTGKLIASIAILSMILPSILLLSFICVYKSLRDYVAASLITEPDSDNSRSMLKYLALVLLVEIAFFIVYFAISHISGIATILVASASASYTGDRLSPNDLLSSIKRTWRKTLFASFRFSRSSSTRYLSVLIFLAVLLVLMYPNVFTISSGVIIGIVVFGFQLYSSVVSVLSLVIIVLDDGTSPGQAMEKGASLIKGNRLKGFMLNLFFNLVFMMFWVLGLALKDKVSKNLIMCGLIFVNVFSIMKMILLMAYTVLYFQCKKEHGEEINVVGNAEYTKLSTRFLDNEIP